MAPKKKRCRKSVADSGLGVSLKERVDELVEKETCVNELIEKGTCVPDHGNLERESELGGKDRQSPQAENGCLTKENGSLEKKLDSVADSHSPENADCFLDETAESPRKANASPQETEGTPNKIMQLPEAEASDVCINDIACDSDSEKTMRELLQAINFRSQSSDKMNESACLIFTACAEGNDNDKASGYSSETEIFVGRTGGIKASMVTREPLNDENLSLSKICASQKTGKSVGGDQELEEAVVSKDSVIVPVKDTPAVTSHSCPAEISLQRHILNSGRQRLINPVVSSFGKRLPFRSKVGFQFHHQLPGRRGSVIHESPEFMEQQNRGEQIEKGDVLMQPSTQSLSVWSEAQSEYFPRGKPSDLGELLEVATRYVVKAWVKDIDPSISGAPTNLVIKFCNDCHRKYHYDEDDTHHLCSRPGPGSQNSLKLMFYVELEIYDETHEMLRVALTGNQATKLFGCQPQEFIKNAAFQKRIWNSFKCLIKGGNTQNWCLKDAADFSLEPHLKGKTMNYRVVDIRPFRSCST